jgi:4-amino-4-deoxy-L-arabinose transferase-like glycosyltransferase
MKIPFLPSKWQNAPRLYILVFFLFLIPYSVFYIATISTVPFHPDESTQIYMSSDIDLMHSSFNQLFWQPGSSADLRQHYRLLDSPLTRYLIGIGRALTATPPLTADWDWSGSWLQNATNGALPSAQLLLIARLSVACLSLLSLVLIFDLLWTTFNPLLALVTVFILAFNPLFLLHTRRAMAESALIFFSLLSLVCMVRWSKYPIWVGIATALAFCSKQSAVVLVIPALIALLAQPDHKFSDLLSRLVKFSLAWVLTVILLNPFCWLHPIEAVSEAYTQRLELTRQQQSMIYSVSPEKDINAIPNKVASLIGALFFAPPAVADVANYIKDTASAETNYFAFPLNNLGFGFSGGGLALILTLIGFVLLLYRIIKQQEFTGKPLILLVAFLCSLIAVFLFTPLPFQRYYLLVLPFNLIWIALALTAPLNFIKKKQAAVLPQPE